MLTLAAKCIQRRSFANAYVKKVCALQQCFPFLANTRARKEMLL